MRKIFHAAAVVGFMFPAVAYANSSYYGYSVCQKGDTFVGCVGPWATGFWISSLEFPDHATCEAYLTQQKTLALQLGKQFPGGVCFG